MTCVLIVSVDQSDSGRVFDGVTRDVTVKKYGYTIKNLELDLRLNCNAAFKTIKRQHLCHIMIQANDIQTAINYFNDQLIVLSNFFRNYVQVL